MASRAHTHPFTALPELLLPPAFQRLAIFFDVVEQSYCFLLKRKMRCTVGNLGGLYNHLVCTTELRDDRNWSAFQMGYLEAIVDLCSHEFKLQQSDPTSADPQLRELSFVNLNGPGKGHSAQRKKILLNALWDRVGVFFMGAMGISELDKKWVSSIKKCGWPSQAEIQSCTLSSIPTAPAPSLPSKVEEKSAEAEAPLRKKRFAGGFQGSFADFLHDLEEQPFYEDQIKHVEYYPAKAAEYDVLDRALPPVLQSRLLEYLGIEKFYTHQAMAINAIRSGRHLIVATSTSSGKSLVYNIPVIEAMMESEDATALYLFPTKALAQDQLRCLHELVGPCPDLNTIPMVCDGDTPLPDRIQIMKSVGNVILTNPDMLHYTLLPEHKAWKRLFANLRYVVIDEAHHYRGAFGAHTSAVFRRLLRVCLHYHCRPQFICCSATIANPLRHVLRLLPLHAMSPPAATAKLHSPSSQPEEESEEEICQQLRIEVITSSVDGAPRGERTVVIWNPPLKVRASQSSSSLLSPRSLPPEDGSPSAPVASMPSSLEELQFLNEAALPVVDAPSPASLPAVASPSLERRSTNYETSQLLAHFLISSQRTLAFCRVRKLVELVYKYTQHILEHQYHRPDLLPRLSSYRGGYTKDERRQIEYDLFHRNLHAVAATNALELGINIGELNATLHMGFPGTFSSLLQQMGRAGRSTQPSLHVVVCFNCPMDQFFAQNPDHLVQGKPESVVVECNNRYILRNHLVYAAQEVPLGTELSLQLEGEQSSVRDDHIWGPEYQSSIQYLLDRQEVYVAKGSRTLLISSRSAESKISLRMIDPITITVLNEVTGEALDSIGYSRAFYELFEGAVYMHRGAQYLVKALDIPNQVARVRPVHVKYHTSAQNRTDVNIIKVLDQDGFINTGIGQVLHSIYGFEKRYLYSNVLFERGECKLPPLEYETHLFWIDIPVSAKREVEQGHGISIGEAVHTVNHCIVNRMSMFIACDSSDIDCEHGDRHNRILVYDRHLGGTGVSITLFKNRDQVLRQAKELLLSCPCQLGCPACVFDTRCKSYNHQLNKPGAIVLLQSLLELRQSMLCQPCEDSPTRLSPGGDIAGQATAGLKRKNDLDHSSFRNSVRARGMEVQKSWTESVPNFVTESHHQL